ncbi:MAG: hypothetical protein ABSC38_06205, partial [Verrucomicrobiia bacterium]
MKSVLVVFTLIALAFIGTVMAASSWTAMKDAQFAEQFSDDEIRATGAKLTRLYGRYKNIRHLSNCEIDQMADVRVEWYKADLRKQILGLKADLMLIAANG